MIDRSSRLRYIRTPGEPGMRNESIDITQCVAARCRSNRASESTYSAVRYSVAPGEPILDNLEPPVNSRRLFLFVAEAQVCH